MSIFPGISLTFFSVYIHFTAENNFGGGQPYFFNISTINLWLELLNALTSSANICNIVLIVKLPSWHTTPGVDPNWYFAPCFLVVLNNLVHRMLLNIFDLISISVTPLHLLGSLRSEKNYFYLLFVFVYYRLMLHGTIFFLLFMSGNFIGVFFLERWRRSPP